MLPAAVVHIHLAVVVLVHHLVDRLGDIDDLVDQRAAQRILERPSGAVADRHAGAVCLAIDFDVISAKEQVLLTVMLDGPGGPHRVGDPRDVFDFKHMLVFGRVDQVGRREGMKKGLFHSIYTWPAVASPTPCRSLTNA